MDQDKNSFQDRLKKIEKKQAEAPKATPKVEMVADTGPSFAPSSGGGSPIGSKLLMMVGGATLLLAGAGIFLRDATAHDDVTAMVLNDGEAREVSLLGRMLGGSFDPDSVKAQKPIYHLPEAPDGWVRATLSDVRKISALDQLRGQWPENAEVTLDQNPGFSSLSKFVRMNQVKTNKTKALEEVQAQAHYLAGNGAHLQVLLKFLPDGEELGPENAGTAWAQKMFADRTGFPKGQAPVITTFDGRPAIGRGNVALDPTDTALMPIELAVPLTQNSYIRIIGKAAPADVAKLVDGVSVRGLLAFAG
ncbi:hypothetical protein GQ651_10235 [Alphaproteobacteria bacterium GH1-50]|uniref:Uncharacterized protein n=1 Tax=Kangsaoukella pontilimi TaxID=2691042 RepID=A0A7C9MW91_9RHOB|nr:hypothetical protein [Kangsaoukella pontilimi]MXQ08220.1 hypothetical protein [Kangsaoukella pontilimi]